MTKPTSIDEIFIAYDIKKAATNVESARKQATQILLDLFLSWVPEELTEIMDYPKWERPYIKGHNACLATIKQRIEEERGWADINIC